MATRLCYAITNLGFPIKLHQKATGLFAVTYGLQLKSDLDYAQAAAELGSCIMHALACESKLDNGE